MYYTACFADEKFNTENYFIAQHSYDEGNKNTEQIYFEYSKNSGESYGAQYNICEKMTFMKDKIIVKIKDKGIIEIDITEANINESFFDFMNKVFGNLIDN